MCTVHSHVDDTVHCIVHCGHRTILYNNSLLRVISVVGCIAQW